MKTPFLLRFLLFKYHGTTYNKYVFPTIRNTRIQCVFAENLLRRPVSLLHTNKTPNSGCPTLPNNKKLNRSDDGVSEVSGQKLLSDAEIQRVNELLSSLCENGNLQVALDLMDASLSVGCLLKSLNLNVLIDSLCKEKKMVHARKFINRLKHEKYSNKGDILTSVYILLIDEYCKQCKVMEAMEVLNEMMKSDDLLCLPDGHVFATVVEGCCKVKRLSLAIRVLRSMLDRSFLPEPRTQIILVRSFLREARVREAYKLQDIFESLGKGNGFSSAKGKVIVGVLDQMLDGWTA